MITVRIYHDFASPFSYLGTTQVESVCSKHGATLVWCPMVLGGVFKAVGQVPVPLMTFPPAKRRLYVLDMFRFAELYGVPFGLPTRFPMRTIDALRLVLAAREQSAEAAARLTHRIYRAYWGEDQDIANPAILAALCQELDLDGPALLARSAQADIKARLFAATDEAVQRGVFGAPTFVLEDGTLLWGQDRLPLLDWMLAQLSQA
jgi:2-hydroxychromene-2-carboxylate isomerase